MLVDKKILESERNQVYVKSNEGVRLNGSVAENKDVFDKFPQLIMNKYNELIDLLIASGLDTVADDFLNRYTKTETDSLIETETSTLVADIGVDLATGVITVTKKDGSKTTIDTALEKVPSTFEFVEDAENDRFYIKVTNVDGTSSQTEVTNLMNQYTFSDGDIVSFVINKSGTTTTVTANIKNGSIGLAQLSTEVKQYYEEIKSSVSADRAAVEADKAVVLDASQTVTANTALVLSYKEAAEENALLSKSYAIGNTGTRADEDTDNSMYYSNEAKYARNQAQAAQNAAEEARDRAQQIVGGNFANHTLITIPAGRMRGDVDGDGKFTQEDTTRLINGPTSVESITKYYSMSFSTQFPDGNIPIDFLAADINGDNKINNSDLNQYNSLIFSGTKKPGAYTEVTGNWTNNPNYATEEGQFYTEIAITGMTANHSASVIVKGTYENGFFPKAECVEGAIRIYAKLCPIEALLAVVSWGSGNGTAVITTESEDLTAYAEHIANADVHVTTEEKAVWSEKEVFIITLTETTAEGGTTSYSADKTFDEIKAASNEGKICILKHKTSIYIMTIGGDNTQAGFSRCNTNKLHTFVVSSHNAWNYGEYYALPIVTADDNGKILKVVDGVWAAVTPS